MKTKNLLGISFMLTLLYSITFGLSSCSKEDNDDNYIGSNPGEPSNPVETQTSTDAIGGQYLKSIIEQSWFDDTLPYICNLYDFSYKGGKVSVYQTDFEIITSSSVSGKEWNFILEHGEVVRFSNIISDEKGRILSFVASEEKSDDRLKKTSYTFTYNISGQLSQIKGRSLQGNDEDILIRIIWSNNNISSVVIEDEYWPQTISFTYGTRINTYQQMPMTLARCVFDSGYDDLELIRGLLLIGKFGMGPQYLPESYTTTNMYNDEEPYAITYKFNLNGTIQEEVINNLEDSYNRKYLYSYE